MFNCIFRLFYCFHKQPLTFKFQEINKCYSASIPEKGQSNVLEQEMDPYRRIPKVKQDPSIMWHTININGLYASCYF